MPDGEGLNHLDVVELKQTMAGLAEITWIFYEQLKKQGFTPENAMKLTQSWLIGTAGGSA
jgi:hypothetical protein